MNLQRSENKDNRQDVQSSSLEAFADKFKLKDYEDVEYKSNDFKIPQDDLESKSDIREISKCAKKLFTMLPGSFKIVLCVDNMEVAGG